MITASSIQFTIKSFFSTLLQVYLKKRWWLLVWLLLVSVALLFKEKRDSVERFMVFIGFIYPVIVVFQYWRFANSKENKVFFFERTYNITEEKITGNLSDGTVNDVLISHFVKVIVLKKCFLLYLSKNQFLYFPISAFKTESDKTWFQKMVVNKIKNTRI